MDAPVSTTFTYTRREYVLAMRRHYKSTLRVKFDIVGGLLAVAGGLYLALIAHSGAVGWLLAGLGAALLAIVAYAMLLLPHIIYSSQPKLAKEYALSFADDCIRFKTEDIDSTVQWSLYHAWLSDDQFYILYHGKRNLTVIPRRALADADDTLRKLLTAHIGAPRSYAVRIPSA